jgi:hypothetical protein
MATSGWRTFDVRCTSSRAVPLGRAALRGAAVDDFPVRQMLRRHFGEAPQQHRGGGEVATGQHASLFPARGFVDIPFITLDLRGVRDVTARS